VNETAIDVVVIVAVIPALFAQRTGRPGRGLADTPTPVSAWVVRGLAALALVAVAISVVLRVM
jgi:hypothetical protein